jgi:CAAX prenyl protease-like protein
MWALSRPPDPPSVPFLAGTPTVLLVSLGTGAVAAWALAHGGHVPPTVLRGIGLAVSHGALLATAVAWAGRANAAEEPAAREWSVLPALAVVLVGVCVTIAELVSWGAVAYVAPALWVWRLGEQKRVLGLGRERISIPFVLVGLAAGSLLGGHLLFAASRTLGYRPVLSVTPERLRRLAYDAGLNVLSAETFFRGALFDRAQRQWSFELAAAVSAAACVIRYLLDPLLPGSIELLIGAAFYISLLSVLNCWMFRRSGSLVPGFACGVAFFAAYRCLGTW